MEGVQSNTYDVDFYGPNPMCETWYLAALRACAEMPLPRGCRYVLRRVVLLANKRLTRWAIRETRHLAQLSADSELMEVQG